MNSHVGDIVTANEFDRDTKKEQIIATQNNDNI